MLIQLARGPLDTAFGTWDHRVYWDGRSEAIAMVFGDVAGSLDTLARIHSSCVTGNVFLSVECECRAQLEAAMRLIQRTGAGVIVWLDQEGRGNGKAAHIASQHLKKGPERLSQAAAYLRLGCPPDARSYRVAAEVFRAIRACSVVLLTDNDRKVEELRGHGIAVIMRSMRDLITAPGRSTSGGLACSDLGEPAAAGDTLGGAAPAAWGPSASSGAASEEVGRCA